MASYTYDAYAAKRAAQRSTNPNGGLGPEVRFLNEFLRDDGDVVVVRFPYHSMSDLIFETTHAVVFPGKRFPSRVRCTGDATCPFCVEKVKLDTRFFAKVLAYVIDEQTSEVNIINAVWDRPSAFADIDIKNLMQEYGDISNFLFKIKRNGSGTATRYTITIVTNTTVYNPAIYKADFSELDKVEPIRILSKSLEQYKEALNPSAPKQAVQPQPQTYAQPQTYTQPAQQQPYISQAPTPQSQTIPTQPIQEQSNTGVQQDQASEQRRPTTRYKF